MRASTLVTVSILGIGTLTLSGCSLFGEDAAPEDRTTIASIMGQPSYENVDYAEQEAKVQDLIAECMINEGWEYIPVVYPDQTYEYSDEDELERLKREGLGFAYYVLNPNGAEGVEDPWAEWVDPNQDYVSSLSESEQQAYYESLIGTQEEQQAFETTEVDPETGEEYTIVSGYGAGCQGEAQKEVYGEDLTQSPEYWEAMEAFYADLQERAESDPRIVELDKKWAACMKEEGFEYESQTAFWEDGYTEYQERLNEILGDDYYKDPMEGWTQEQMDEFWETATQEEIDAFFTQPEPTDAQRTQLEELLADEIKVAVAQFTCSGDYNEQMTEIYAEIEETFALEHEEELRALAASLTE